MKVPKPPAPPPAPDRGAADNQAESLRRRLAARKGAGASIKTTELGAPDYGKNAQVPGLTGGTSATLGMAA